MNKLNFYKNLIMSLERAFTYTQDMAFLNLQQRFDTLFTAGGTFSSGILSNFGGVGKLVGSNPFGVTILNRTTRSIKISPGVAIDSSGDLIYNGSDYTTTLDSTVGTHYIVLSYKEVSTSSGKDGYYGGGLKTPDSLKTLTYDSFQIDDLTADPGSGAIVLATIYVKTGGTIDNDATAGTLDAELKVETIPTIASIASGFSYTYNSNYPYILIGTEYVGANATDILTRGQLDTVQNKHSIGEAISYSPLIDRTQQHLMVMNIGKTELEQLMDNGIFKTSDGNYHEISTVGGLTPNRVVVTDSSGKETTSDITSAELNMLDGIGTTTIKTQLDGKVDHFNEGSAPVGDRVIVSDGQSGVRIKESTVTKTQIESMSGYSGDKVLLSNAGGGASESTVTSSELNNLSGTTMPIQFQLDIINSAKADKTELNRVDVDDDPGAHYRRDSKYIYCYVGGTSVVQKIFDVSSDLHSGFKIIGFQYSVYDIMGVAFNIAVDFNGNGTFTTIVSNSGYATNTKGNVLDTYNWNGDEIVGNAPQIKLISHDGISSLDPDGVVAMVFYYEYTNDMTTI